MAVVATTRAATTVADVKKSLAIKTSGITTAVSKSGISILKEPLEKMKKTSDHPMKVAAAVVKKTMRLRTFNNKIAVDNRRCALTRRSTHHISC